MSDVSHRPPSSGESGQRGGNQAAEFDATDPAEAALARSLELAAEAADRELELAADAAEWVLPGPPSPPVARPAADVTHEPPVDPIEAALARALELAASASEWSVVATLATQLEARRRARVAPGVADIDEERARRQK